MAARLWAALVAGMTPSEWDIAGKIASIAWKVGAGETSNLPLLEKMARTGKPVILSSGLSDWAELDAAVNCVRSNGAEVAVLQCTTA